MSKSSNGSAPAEALTININPFLLERLSKYCFRTELTKSQVVSMALKSFLAGELAKDPAFWEIVYDKYEENGKS